VIFQKFSRVDGPSNLCFFSLSLLLIDILSYELFKLFNKRSLVIICLLNLLRCRLFWRISDLSFTLFVMLFFIYFIYHLYPLIHYFIASQHQLPLFSLAVLNKPYQNLPDVESCWQKCELFYFLQINDLLGLL